MHKYLLIALLGLSGCASLSTANCIMYGVEPNWHTQTVRHAEAVSQKVINEKCGTLYGNHRYRNAGCMKPVAVGVVELYWLKGDKCVETHEWCHALHGFQHTKAYRKRLEARVPNPACPFGN
jgi:hypothetical protein